MWFWGRGLLSFQYLMGIDVTSELITECDDRKCPLFGKRHWHCPCCNEALVAKPRAIFAYYSGKQHVLLYASSLKKPHAA